MTTIKKYRNSIEGFLHSDAGQRFFNIAYSVGAAIVIWGALFKILHLPGGNTLLCVGMGTEIAMFLLTAFDRPPKEPNWDEIVPALTGKSMGDEEAITIEDDLEDDPSHALPGEVGGAIVVGGTRITPPQGHLILDGGAVTEEFNTAAEELSKVSDLAGATTRFVEAIEGISKQMSELHDTLTIGSEGYAEHIKDLNRNLAGLNTIYEIQLRSISGQLDAIDRVNKGLKDIRDMYEKSASDSARYCEESEKMTQYMQQINAMYARMISAMSIQMPVAAAPAPAPAAPASAEPPVSNPQPAASES